MRLSVLLFVAVCAFAADAPKPTLRLAPPIEGQMAKEIAVARFHLEDAKAHKAAMIQQAEQQGDEEIRNAASEDIKVIRKYQAVAGVSGDCKPSSELIWIHNDGTPCMVAAKEQEKK